MSNQFILPLKPCPWCKCCPGLYLPYDDRLTKTWLWEIKCNTHFCAIKPKAPYVPIRNTCKLDPHRMREKIYKLAGYWNNQNDLEAIEGRFVNLDELIEKYKATLNEK